MNISVLDAPSNLGLRPPGQGLVPGTYKAPLALRDQGLLSRLNAADAGGIVPPRYSPCQEEGRTRNSSAIADYSVKLADRICALLSADRFPLLLGGDCSILIGSMLALRRRGRYGLAFIDGHCDFRHTGNSPKLSAAAGEDLAIVLGLGDPALTKLEDRGPLLRSTDVCVLGPREGDTDVMELRARGITVSTSHEISSHGVLPIAAASRRFLEQPQLEGFWIHFDVDAVDERLMPAVDSPESNGLTFDEAAALLTMLLASPKCVGMQVTIFDPDLDRTGRVGADLVDCLINAFVGASAVASE